MQSMTGPITTVKASIPLLQPPAWALWERELIEIMEQAVYPYLAKYTRSDGTLIWRDDQAYETRDGADDFYESFYNWPLLYLLGGADQVLELAELQWDAVTQQLSRLGLVHKEYERGYDQFHQGESSIYFYFLCLADPTHPRLIERAKRFAGFYLNEDPDAQNYDPEHRVIRAPHNGSAGPRWGYFYDEVAYHWTADMEPYGLPYLDVEGVGSYEDLRDPVLAARMGEVMQERMGKGDVATNLIVTSLVANAYLLTGEEKYRRWIVEYVAVWQERARRNGGLLPDNVGLSGRVGEYIDGKWYGGLYGWSWPHGYYNVCMAAIVATTCAYLLTGEKSYLDLPRSQIDRIHELGQTSTIGELASSVGHFWIEMQQQYGSEREIFLVPYRYNDTGWFEYLSPSSVYPVALWNLTQDIEDWARVEQARRASLVDWCEVVPFRNKEDGGHELPWLCFLKGEKPAYPEQILSESYGQVARRMEMIRGDDSDLRQVSIHHWQELNPVLTEALVQLTLGAPQIIYNGGLLMCQVRYFDVQRRRPGLPPDVAALVEKIEEDHIVVCLLNLSVFDERDLLLQAGAFGEHEFRTVQYEERVSQYPGPHGPAGYAAPELRTEHRTMSMADYLLRVVLPPASEITLTVGIARFVNVPSYRQPWERLC